MKIVFFGDSITDMGRARDVDGQAFGYGVGYVNSIASTLKYEDPKKYEIINRGIGGNRIVDLYARIKADVWNFNPIWAVLVVSGSLMICSENDTVKGISFIVTIICVFMIF